MTNSLAGGQVKYHERVTASKEQGRARGEKIMKIISQQTHEYHQTRRMLKITWLRICEVRILLVFEPAAKIHSNFVLGCPGFCAASELPNVDSAVGGHFH